MAKICFVVSLLLCFSACNFAAGRKPVEKFSNGSLNIPHIEYIIISTTLTKDFDGKGLEPWYDIAKSFVHTVQKDDLPYDDIEKAKDGDFKAAEFLNGWELPFLVVFGIGFLFAIIVPIVGFCFCCCRCCGNCGGEMGQKQGDRDGLKRAVFGVVLSIITLLMFAGCLMAFVSNDRITDTVNSYETTPIKAIRDVEKYFNKTLNVVTGNIIGNVLDILKIVTNEVIDLPTNLANDVIDNLSDLVRVPLDRVVKLADETEKMKELLIDINNTTTALQTRYTRLQNNITSINQNLTSAGLPTLTTGANFSTLPDVSSELQNIINITNTDFAGNAKKGLQELDDIGDRIKEETNNTSQTISVDITNAQEEFENTIRKDIVAKVDEQVLDKTDGWVKDIQDAFDDAIKPYDKYRYIAGVGLVCLILLPVLLMAFGLLCGIFGYDKHAGPTDRGAVSNMGGNCLMAAVGFMFIFVFFLMLFCAVCFIIGAHLEKGCYSVREETLYKDFLDQPKYWDDKYLLSESIFDNGSKVLKIKEILSSCRSNNAIFQAIKGHLKWDLTETFSVKDKLGDIDENLDKFSTDTDLADQKILNNETKTGLQDLQTSNVDNINFDQFFNETGKDVINYTLVDSIQDSLKAGGSTNISARLESIQNEAKSMQNVSKDLQDDVDELKKLGGNISKLANDTLAEAEAADAQYKSRVDDVVKTAVTKYKDMILGYVDQGTAWAANTIENDLGRCKILADVYDAATNLLCRDTVYPFNGFWFSLGFCLFFYIPAIILSVKLAKHYRRMRFEEGFDRHDNGVEMSDVGRNKSWHNQGNSVYPR